MDVRERFWSMEEAMRTAIEGALTRHWTALPVIIESFDPVKMTASVQPAVKSMVVQQDGSQKYVDLPLIVDAPVHFPAGGGATMTFPLTKGDEAWAIISSRSIDAWHQSGGVQQQTDARVADISDAAIFVGTRSQPRALANVSTTSTQLRSDDGEHVIDLHPTNGLSMTSSKDITIDAPNLRVTGDVIAGTVSLKTHLHTETMPGAGESGPPAA
jgi:hypothetical protein